MRLFLLATSLLVLLAAGCASPSPVLDPATKRLVDEAASPALAIYLCSATNTGGTIHYYLRSTWRHDSRLGAIPAQGSEILPSTPKSAVASDVSSVLVFIYDPPVRLPNGNLMPNRSVYVFGDRVQAFHLSLAETERWLRTNAPKG